MDQKLTNSIVDRLNTQHVNFHQRRITNAAPSVDQNDYVVRSELHEKITEVNRSFEKIVGADQHYTIVYTKSDIVTTGEMTPDFVVGDDREGKPTEAWVRCKVAPLFSILKMNFTVNGVTLLNNPISIPIGSLGPVFSIDLAIFPNMGKGTTVCPVIVQGDSVATFITAGVIVRRNI